MMGLFYFGKTSESRYVPGVISGIMITYILLSIGKEIVKAYHARTHYVGSISNWFQVVEIIIGIVSIFNLLSPQNEVSYWQKFWISVII